MTSRLYTSTQVRSFDRMAIETLAIPGYELMRRAAAAAWRVLRTKWPQARRIAVFCGSGNNGGDGYLLACLVRESGLEAFVVELTPPARNGDPHRACAQWREAGGQTVPADAAMLPLADVYVDALFGTGLNRAIDGDARALIERINASERPLLALDIPSGIDANSGAVLGIAVRAAATVSFVAHKRGLFTGAALNHCGELFLDELGLPENVFKSALADTRVMVMRRMMRWLPPREIDANKGIYGHVLALGSDVGMGGAIRLSGEAALRVGAGLVSVATRPENVVALNAARPELMAIGVADSVQFEPMLQRADVIAIGPGLGDGEWSKALWNMALDAGKPTVLDADGLNLLAKNPRRLPQAVIITPHPGEAARLLKCDVATIQRDRYAAAIELARRFRAVAVLKGAGSLVAHPEGGVLVCPWGNPGMASGGMGDVLTGVIAGLLAQGLNCWRAARFGVGLHAQAGDAAAADGGEAGLLASDLFQPLRRLRNAHADNG